MEKHKLENIRVPVVLVAVVVVDFYLYGSFSIERWRHDTGVMGCSLILSTFTFGLAKTSYAVF